MTILPILASNLKFAADSAYISYTIGMLLSDAVKESNSFLRWGLCALQSQRTVDTVS